MHDVSLFENKPAAEKTMTVKEVAEVLGVSRELITKRIRELFPEKMQHGSTTYLNEAEVTVIKKRIEQNAHLATSYDRTKLVDMPKTNLEKHLLIRQAMQLQNEMIAELEAENKKLKTELETQKPKAAYYDALIERGNSTSIRNTAKELNIPEKQFVKKLLVDGFLYRDKKGQLCPYAEYIQKGYFEVKEWQQGEKNGMQTLITVAGKQYLINKYTKAA
ncbi:MAG: phage antirepressor KilAC domain-containing protein [Treponema sp.]